MILPALQFIYPEAAALALPAALAWWRWCAQRHGRWWRALILLALVLAAMQPELAWGRGGSDVVVVLDRSQSMLDIDSAAGDRRRDPKELVKLIGDQRRDGDRLAVVVVGENARVAQGPQATGVPLLSDWPVDASASELALGLDVASGLIPPGRTGRVVLHSDGEFTGLEPRRAANRLAAAGIAVDVLSERRPAFADAAVLDIELPQHLRLGESFLAAVRFLGDREEKRKYRIFRGDKPIADGTVELSPLQPATVSFADRPPQAGLAQYRVELDASDDRQPLNNRATAALHVAGGERVLVVGGDGTPGNVARALQAAGLNVVCRAEGPLGLDGLLGFKVLVLEQVPADRLGINGLEAIARWVEHLGGGLVMTGGRRSFGAGGYHKSAVERVLPVTMELRDEHRKLAVTMAITLDRSGSMSAPVGGGRQKMDLANEGAAAAIEMLTPRDQVAVHAVDTSPHVIVPLTVVTNPAALARQVLGIESMGGGIYVYQALLGAGQELLKTSTGTRHLVLFADANDAEEPGDYVNLLADYQKAGITVSVIGMGSEKDSDADFLKDVAKRGGGRISFAEKPEDIPRLFSQETILVARASWVSDAVKLRPLPPLQAELGANPLLAGDWPTVPGYNLTYARDRATVLALAPGDPQAPALASWRIGTGRAVAVCCSVDDPQSGELLKWPGYGPALAGLVRWAAGGDETAPGALFAERAGRTVTLRLELDPAQRQHWPATAPRLVLSKAGDVGEAPSLTMDAVDEGRFEAVVQLSDAQVLMPAVAVERSAILGPALALPYSPEAEPRFGQAPGHEVLATIARETRGKVRDNLLDVYKNPPSPGELRSLSGPLLGAALAALVLEIAVRRFQLAFARRKRTVPTAVSAPAAGTAPAAATAAGKAPGGVATPGAIAKDEGLHEALRQLKQRRK